MSREISEERGNEIIHPNRGISAYTSQQQRGGIEREREGRKS